MVRASYILMFLIILSIVFGCSSTETIIKDRKIEITVPAVKDSLPIVYKEFPKTLIDSLEKIFAQLPDSARIEAVRIDNPETRIKYYPKKKFFELDIASQKVDTTITDTTTIVEKKQTTTAEKFGYGTIGIIVFVIIAIVVFLGFKFKWV